MLRMGVIGVGYLGRLHAQKLASLDDVALVGVCDADRERGERVAEEFGTSFRAGSRELLREIDAVSIAVPTTAHYGVAKEAMRTGVHILLEKPIAATVREGRALVREAEARRLVFQIGHLERFNSAVLSAASVLTEPRFVECHRLPPLRGGGTGGGGVVVQGVPHPPLLPSLSRGP